MTNGEMRARPSIPKDETNKGNCSTQVIVWFYIIFNLFLNSEAVKVDFFNKKNDSGYTITIKLWKALNKLLGLSAN